MGLDVTSAFRKCSKVFVDISGSDSKKPDLLAPEAGGKNAHSRMFDERSLHFVSGPSKLEEKVRFCACKISLQ